MNKRSFPTAVSQFMDHPDVLTLREVLELGGEFDCLDFKREWNELKGAGRSGLAKDVLSFANSDGGLIVIGVADDGSALGLNHLLDPAMVRSAIASFLPTGPAPFTLWPFELDGRRYQVLLIKPDDELLPYEAARSGTGIERGRVYIRAGTTNTEATSAQMIELMRRRDAARSVPLPTVEEMLNGLELCYARLDSEAAIEAAARAGNDRRQQYNHYLKELIGKTERAIERRLIGHS
jgi:predicted HTH transcriptional regulator